ncbi:MAG: DUF2971 domain-containing protein [Caulobacter sp.]|nr:DUF2971 domain-containing protein [Caulobacter sp.]
MTDSKGFLYKYLPAELADVVFTEDNHVTIKFSKPKDFNDPYELFLDTDFGGDPEMLAYYAEAIGDLPQLPTTCFSRSPVVMPMWAHYAYNHIGFVIEFSEEAIREEFEESRFDDVKYTDGPSHDFSDLVARILHIGKPRYTYFLQGAVFNAAYFTKSTCWSYEQERRMVVRNSDVITSGDLMLMNISDKCVSSIICGARATLETKDKLQEVAEKFSAEYYELRIGRTSAIPYLVDRRGGIHSFTNSEIEFSKNYCASCSEPIEQDNKECIWCQITDDTKMEAAVRNPFRIIDSYGGLEEYIRQMDAVGRAVKTKK